MLRRHVSHTSTLAQLTIAEMNPMIALNMCDFCSHERSECGAQPVLANALKLENLKADYKDCVVACDKYISPVDVLKERFHDPDL